MVRHLLVTNDYPPKIGGIQNYLWELWRRLPADDVVVHTTPYEGSEAFDAAQDHPIIRSSESWLLPQPVVTKRVNRLIAEHKAEVVILDPAVPVGLIGPHLDVPYGVVLHGAEVTIPGRIPGSRHLLNRVLAGASGIIAAGGYPAAEGERSLGRALPPCTIVPPGVDAERFVPLDNGARTAVRARYDIAPDQPMITSVSRLVPRKGMDTLIAASTILAREFPDLAVVVAGRGRDTGRLQGLIDDTGAPVRLVGRLPEDELIELYGAGDVFSMLCRSRWGGLEQEGFGIVFVEAAAAGVAQVAGRSGGAHEAVAHGETGLVVDDPTDPEAAAEAIATLLRDPARRSTMATASRARALNEFDYGVLAARLGVAIDAMVEPS